MRPSGRPLKVALIAGEASGDQLGGHLMAGLRSLLNDDVTFMGVGGQMMEEQGLPSLFAMSDLSVMGIGEVLPKLPKLLARVSQTTAAVAEADPDVLVTIDSPDFCLRVAKRLKKHGSAVPIAHYVAPSVWAWRPGRAQKMARIVDHVLALLPFEPPYMTAAGVTCDFVGHPVAAMDVASADEVSALREMLHIAPEAQVLCLLPGSRMGELKRHGEAFGDALHRFRAGRDNLEIVLPAAGSIAEAVSSYADTLPFRAHVLDPRQMTAQEATRARLAAYRMSDLALAVSGTVSLELASQATPMVICWDAGKLTRAMLRRMFRLDTATLVNLVSETRAVPELFFDQVTPDNIAALLSEQWDDPQKRAAQVEAADLTMARLGRGAEGGGLRAARSVLDRFDLLPK